MKSPPPVVCVILFLTESVTCSSPSSNLTDVLASSINNFSFDLHRLLAAEEKNLFYSPLGLSTALAMLYHGARGETEAEMCKVLGYDTVPKSKIPAGYEELLNTLNSVDVANAALLQKQFAMNPQYKDDLQNFFDALAVEVDFANRPREVTQYVNSWVKNKTRGNIEKFLDSVQQDTVFMLLNTMYFEGKWEERFFPREDGVFYNNGLESQAKYVPMMGRVRFSKIVSMPGNYSVLELLYETSDVSMWILLPNERNGLTKLEQRLTDATVKQIDNLLAKKNINLLNLKLPKFKMEFKREMKSVLETLGMRTVFGNRANFTGVTKDGRIKVGRVLHGAKIEVDELGSVATATTSIEAVPLTYPQDVNVDHPFLFWIIDQRSLTILFTGRIATL